MLNVCFSFIICFFITIQVSAQTTISGVVNDYAAVDSVESSCNRFYTDNSGSFSQGDDVLLIQMQGADINTDNSGDFGNITQYNNAGNYEWNEVYDIDGNALILEDSLSRTYTPGSGFQIVRVPRYTNDVTVSDTLTAQAWNGTTGGVLAVIAEQELTMQAPVDVSGMGFRGGEPSQNGGDCFNNGGEYFYASPTIYGAWKGEGIADHPLNMEAGRGKLANGGGGGNNHNHGGGGGANGGSGGNGGNNNDGCGFTVTNYGMGGAPLTYTQANNKIFAGGGGGGGHQNNYLAPGPPGSPGSSPGANGGGIIFLRANSLNGQGNTIMAKGDTSFHSLGDGAGGGGAGGTVLLETNQYTSPVTINVKGGKGADVHDNTGRNHGPGGGGGGGILWVTQATLDPQITLNVNGGQAGTNEVCGCNRGATNGNDGDTLFNLNMPGNNPDFSPCTPAPVVLRNFKARSKQDRVMVSWETSSETNNQYYILQRAGNQGSFTNLDTVLPPKATNNGHQYHYTDQNPLPGISYYRLIQVDTDGDRTTYPAQSVKRSEAVSISVAPNPFKNYLTLQASGYVASKTESRVALFDLRGRKLHSASWKMNKKLRLPAEHLSEGPYILKVFLPGQVIVKRIIKK